MASATWWAFSRSLPVMRTLMRRRFALVHGAADHAAGVEGEFQVAKTRRSWRSSRAAVCTYSWAECCALVLELDLDHRVHRPGVRRVGGRPVGDDAELADDQFQVVAELVA